MPRNEKIEAILIAWDDFNRSTPAEKTRCMHRLNALLDEAIGDRPLTRENLMTNLSGHYQEFRRTKKLREQSRLPK